MKSKNKTMNLFFKISILIVIPLSSSAQGNTLLLKYSTTYYNPNKTIYQSDLYISKDKGTFYWNNKTEERFENNGLNIAVSALDTVGTINQINFLDNEIKTSFTFGRRRLLNEAIPIMNWEFLDGTQSILGYECKKAKLKFRGREYIAWYADEIPLSIGPWKFTGLPGAILEVYDENHIVTFKCYKINFEENPKEIATENLLNSKEFISINEYISLIDNFMKSIENSIKSKLPRGARLDNFSYQNNQLELSLDTQE